MTVAVKNTSEEDVLTPNNIERSSRISTQINIRHQLKVLIPVLFIQPNTVHLLGCVN